jgi:amino acid adenylation domain-containing protein
MDEASVLPDPERHQVIEICNAAPATPPSQDPSPATEERIQQLFERQVEQTPDTVAVSYEPHSLTYSQLNARANQVGRLLRQKGIGPDQTVGLCVERGLEMMVGLLGILKAGGAYLPLDPNYPSDRLAHLLTDAAPKVVLTQQRIRPHIPTHAAEVISLDHDWETIASQEPGNLDPKIVGLTASHLAYVIYTSGSTGIPKGVMVEHRNVINLWRCVEHLYREPRACRRIGVNAPFTFDASVKQFVQLLSGCTLCLLPEEARLDSKALLDFINRNQIEGIDCTPSQLNTWLPEGLLDGCGSLRTVLVGGEAIDPGLWTTLSRSSRVTFYNVYGPTECTVDSTTTLINGAPPTPHIGRPLKNTRIYLLNVDQRPVPIGAIGEINIAGPGVARGYLNRPELTADRFVQDPFSATANARMYKSGDLGRWRPDGTIEYLGRNDTQVKIRGFRIELGEIQAQLIRHPQVKEAVVIVREDVPGEKHLVAYVVLSTTNTNAIPSTESLRSHLKSVLPDPMIPRAIILLERLPLTASGKLDRGVLPPPEYDSCITRVFEPPQGEMEETLAQIWQSLLRIERVGRNDNFFELGGHSLLIMQMLHRLRRMGLSTQVRQVFDRPVLSALASVLTRGSVEELVAPPSLIPLGCEAITPELLPLVALTQPEIDRVVASVPGGARNVQDIYPLAPLQEGILFHHQLHERGADVYVLPTLLVLSSRQRLDELIAALQAVIDRHDALRTAIVWEELPRPVQVVYRQANLVVEEVALDPDRDPQDQVWEWSRPERRRLELGRAPLMRLQIAADPHGEQWLAMLQLHHITCDQVSMGIVKSEVMAHLRGDEQRISAAAPYRIHVAQVLAHTCDSEAFFRSKLGDVSEASAPFGLLDVFGDGSRIEEAQQQVDAELARRLRARARQLGVSSATLFHAAWALVIASTSGRDDVVFGSVLLGRLQGSAGAQNILGMFINTLPLRLKLRDVTARELVEQTQRELVALLSHEHASLAVAQRCSGIVGSAPLFTALLNYRHSVPNPEAQWSGAVGVRMLAAQNLTNYPITISVDDQGEGFGLVAQTDQRIDPRRLTDYLHTALQSLVSALEGAPRKLALTLTILPHDERQRVLYGFNATDADYPRERLIHELFEEQVERTPDAVAVVYEDQSLTYSQLNARANQLARYLRHLGIGADQLVGLCLERSLEMVVGLLGILKAGGAYVPLDPVYPVERIARMLDDASPRVVLTNEEARGVLASTAAEIIALDTSWHDIGQGPSGNLDAHAPALRSSRLAYVIYTSGSTGIPNGVMVDHRNVISLWQGLETAYRDSRTCQRIALNASFNFDASVQQIVQLLSGRTVFVIPQRHRRDPSLLLAFLQANAIEGVDCTPSQLKSWITAGLLTANTCQLRVVLVGGEPIDAELWSRLARCTDIAFYNVYGPTECTVDSTAADMAGDTTSPHIGHPMENRRVYILDHRRGPAAVGVTGEVYIGGAGVARGYLGRPCLTAERFVPDPFSIDAGARMYRTGDLGQWRADGSIEYLGRNDHQVKIRGFRIELGDIEAQIARHSQVKETVVLARQDGSSDKRLVAYVVPKEFGAEVPSTEALRKHVKEVLPEYMVPSAVVLLERLPLTANGKIDRRALPAPELGAYVSRQYEAPRGEVEEILAGIWQGLLGVEKVGRNDNFFELGGHSLLIVQMLYRLRRVGLSTEVRRVFDSPMLSVLASVLSSGAEEELVTAPNLIPSGCEQITPEMLPLVELGAEQIERIVSTVPGGATNVQDIYPLVPLQEVILFHHQLHAGGADVYVLPKLLVLSSRQRLDELIAALQAVIDHHDILRTAIVWEQLPRPVQVVYRQVNLVVEEVVLDADRDPQDQVREWSRPERQRLELRRAPLMRLQIAADPHSEQWLAMLQFHHITCDQVSMGIVKSEVTAHLRGAEQRIPAAAPYRNHVAQVLALTRTYDSEAFFRGKLGDVIGPSAPFGLLDVFGDGSRIEEAHRQIEAELARRLRARARQLGVSSATLFHAACGLVIASTSGCDDVVFGSVLLGRLQGSAGAQNILGMFINTLPLRLKLRDVTARELVEQTQRELVELLSHEHASPAVAQLCSGIVGPAPLFTALLNYRHSAPNPETQWDSAPGVQALSIPGRTNFPITLSVDDLGEGFVLTAQTDRRIDPHRVIGYLYTAIESLLQVLEQASQTPVLQLAIVPESERWHSARSL